MFIEYMKRGEGKHNVCCLVTVLKRLKILHGMALLENFDWLSCVTLLIDMYQMETLAETLLVWFEYAWSMEWH